MVQRYKMSLLKGLIKFYNYHSNFRINLMTYGDLLMNRLYFPSPPHLGGSMTSSRSLHVSGIQLDLMEFFDDKDNWSAREVKVGRSWKVEELRIKSNSDLHKLWYILLKERNMLLTMKHEYDAHFKPLPNPERIDKVEESMENLEAVVRERNRAYHELETGENGERPRGEAVDCFGLKYTFRMKEHLLPKKFNKKFLEEEKLRNKTSDYKYISNFLARLKEKYKNMDLTRQRHQFFIVCKLLERFPNIDEEALKEKYPDIDIEKAKKSKEARGHRENKY